MTHKAIAFISLALLSACSAQSTLPMFFDAGTANIKLGMHSNAFLADYKANCNDPVSMSYCFSSDDHTASIKLTTYPGGGAYDVYFIEIKQQASNYPVYPLNAGQLISHKQIELGMSPDDLVAILGQPKIKVDNVYAYRAENHPAISAQYNMPLYDAFYTFEKDRLISMRFGFEYP